jgi:hypothetical protein
MPRLARRLYATSRERAGPREGGLDLYRLVTEARQAMRFEQLFGEPTDLVELVERSVQRMGWTLKRTEILEAVEEFA